MPLWLVWIALAVALVGGIPALTRFVVLTLRAWRDLKRSQRALLSDLDSLAAAGEALGEKSASLGGGSERLDSAMRRLAVSRARLAVLQSALGEATDAVGRGHAGFPRQRPPLR